MTCQNWNVQKITDLYFGCIRYLVQVVEYNFPSHYSTIKIKLINVKSIIDPKL